MSLCNVNILIYRPVYKNTCMSIYMFMLLCVYVFFFLKGTILDYAFRENNYFFLLFPPLCFLIWLQLASAKSTVISRSQKSWRHFSNCLAPDFLGTQARNWKSPPNIPVTQGSVLLPIFNLSPPPQTPTSLSSCWSS